MVLPLDPQAVTSVNLLGAEDTINLVHGVIVHGGESPVEGGRGDPVATLIEHRIIITGHFLVGGC
jgi:hypothetical protein